jgi:hypothetical protein
MKTCSKCKIEKEETEFHKNKSRKSGLADYCKSCMKLSLKNWYVGHKSVARDYIKQWKENNRARCREVDRKWWKNNLEKQRQYRNKPHTKLIRNLRRRLNHVLRGVHKSAHTMELIGCSIEQLKEYLEKQFQSGMSWENYGEWHVDHIRPCASFDLTDPDQQRVAFNYRNLQPLWAKDNLSKGAKYARVM